MEHIFLTGEKQIGKSTAIQRFLSLWNRPVAGFLTTSQLTGDSRKVYLESVDRKRRMLAATFAMPRQCRERNAAAFLELGITLLQESTGCAGITLMDELGFMESTLSPFTAAVLHRLDEDGPVLGVLRKDSIPFLDQVAAHSKVHVIEVTLQNRDRLPQLLLNHFTGAVEPLKQG